MSVATNTAGIFKSSILRASKFFSRNFWNLLPSTTPDVVSPHLIAGSNAGSKKYHLLTDNIFSLTSLADFESAYNAPTILPALVPTIKSTGMLCFSRTSSTPA